MRRHDVCYTETETLPKYVNMNVNSYAQADQFLEVMRLLNDDKKDEAMALLIIIVAAAKASRAMPN